MRKKRRRRLAFTIVDLTLTLPHRRFYPRDAKKSRWLVYHHTAGPETQTPEAIARFHLKKGWAGIGYHYLIYSNGAIFKTRPIGAVPACVDGHNTESLCVAWVGNLSKKQPSPAMWAAGIWLGRLLRKSYPLIKGAKGHGQIPGQATECPGTKVNLAVLKTALEV
jgi:N-acetylmuramoyl-L-alanine amidase